MKLSTKISIEKIRIIANYRKEHPNPMFTAILKAAFDNDSEISVKEAQEQLSGATLTPRMWENMLDRLAAQRYFEKKIIDEDSHFYRFEKRQETFYQLTELGKQVVEKDTFFKSMKGELEVWMLKEDIDWFPYNIVKIVEIKRPENRFEQEIKTHNFNLPEKKILELKNSSFRLDEWEAKEEFLDKKDIILTIDLKEKYAVAVIEDLEFVPKKQDGRTMTFGMLKEDFLIKKYGQNYNSNHQVVKIKYDKNIQFQRSVPIQKPNIGAITFDKITLNKISFTAQTIEDAAQWRLAWIKANLHDYIFEKDVFRKLDNQIQQKFEPYFKLPNLKISEFEKYLMQDKTANFYTLMKIQAPQLLSY